MKTPQFQTRAVLVSRPTQTVIGPLGLVLHLSALEIYPDDPGMGTPMLFENTRGHGQDTTMTWACGYEGSNLGEIIADGETAMKWAESIAEAVQSWETHHWALVTAAKGGTS